MSPVHAGGLEVQRREGRSGVLGDGLWSGRLPGVGGLWPEGWVPRSLPLSLCLGAGASMLTPVRVWVHVSYHGTIPPLKVGGFWGT